MRIKELYIMLVNATYCVNLPQRAILCVCVCAFPQQWLWKSIGSKFSFSADCSCTLNLCVKSFCCWMYINIMAIESKAWYIWGVTIGISGSPLYGPRIVLFVNHEKLLLPKREDVWLLMGLGRGLIWDGQLDGTCLTEDTLLTQICISYFSFWGPTNNSFF